MIDSQGSGASRQGSGRMNSRNRILVILCVLLCFVFLLAVYRQKQVRETENLTLNVALYPIIPDLEKFESDVARSWEAEHPDVELQFVDWSCYSEDPPDDLDVFVFDSIFLSEFIEKGYLKPFPEEKIRNKEDLVPFALEGCREDGVLYAVPQLLCTHFLYTRKGDAELADVGDIVTLYEKIGDRKLQTEIPEENEGLLIDMSGGTTKVVMYLDAQIDCNNAYTEYTDLSDRDMPSEEAVDLLILMRKMGGEAVKAMIISDLHYTEYKEADPLLVPGIAVAEEITDTIVAEVIDKHPDVLIMTGDNTNNGYEGDVSGLTAKLQKVRDAGIPIILTTGNHDFDMMDAAQFEEAYFGLLDPVDRDPASLSYTAIVKDVVFLAMDDNAVNPGGQGEFSPETMQWLSDILAKYRGHTVVFLSHHNVLYGYEEEDPSSHLIRNPELPDLLREGGVKLAMTGHMHFPYITQEDGLWEILSGMPFSGEHFIGNLEIAEGRMSYYAEAIDFAAYGGDVEGELDRLDQENSEYMEQILSEVLEKEGIYGFRKKKVLDLISRYLLYYGEGTLAEHTQELKDDPSYDLMIKGLWDYNYGPWMKAMIDTTQYSAKELEISW